MKIHETKIQAVLEKFYKLHSDYDRDLKDPSSMYEDDLQHGYALGWKASMEKVIFELEEIQKPN
jgi:hypothetical protein